MANHKSTHFLESPQEWKCFSARPCTIDRNKLYSDGAMSGEHDQVCLGFPFKCFQVGFHQFCNIWPRIVMLPKSLCHVSACIEAIFSSMLSSNASIVVDKDLSWWFQLAHNKQHSADPTECSTEASNHGYLALPLMLMHGWAYPTIFYI